jgi:LmbE family N-acetylglucosaminyl deacetylase
LIGLPPASTHIVVLAAHPDDETLGVGGLLAAATRAGHTVTVLVASDGRGSHPTSPTHSPAQLSNIRRVEAVTALAELAPSARLQFLDHPDGELSAYVDQIAEAVTDAIGDDRQDSWLLSTWLHDGHPDHAACARATRSVAAQRERTRLFEYPIWYWHIGTPTKPPAELATGMRLFGFDGEDAIRRARALASYRSQIGSLSDEIGDEAVLPPGVLAHFDRPQDVLLDVGPHPAADTRFFDELYAATPDPWDLRDSWYEQRKRACVLAALPRPTFRRAFEAGSARGDLSLGLVDRVAELITADAAAEAVAAARDRLGARAVTNRMELPAEWPTGRFDLIVLSEVGYYIEDLDGLADRIASSLDDDGVLLMVHWRHVAKQHPLTAETVHLTLRDRLPLTCIVEHVEDDFLLDVLTRDARSVAVRDGVR